MSYTAPTQSNETISQNAANWTALHHTNKSVEQVDAELASYFRDKRLKAIRRYLKERAAR